MEIAKHCEIAVRNTSCDCELEAAGCGKCAKKITVHMYISEHHWTISEYCKDKCKNVMDAMKNGQGFKGMRLVEWKHFHETTEDAMCSEG